MWLVHVCESKCIHEMSCPDSSMSCPDSSDVDCLVQVCSSASTIARHVAHTQSQRQPVDRNGLIYMTYQMRHAR